MLLHRLLVLSMLLLVSNVHAETLYVTDRILLGVHQQPFEQSPIIKSIPSGTKLDVLERQNNFAKVKTKDGVSGWVSETYLMQNQSTASQYDAVFAQYQQSVETLKSVNQQLTKKERELQIKRDQLSNMTTSNKDLRKKLKAKNTAKGNDTDNKQNAVALAEAQKTIDELNAKLLEAEQQKQKVKTSATPSQTEIITLERENTHLRGRIELALANLQGEKVPSPEQIAGIRPSYPLWFWALLIVALAAGIAGGIGWMDFKNRQRHGGFRI